MPIFIHHRINSLGALSSCVLLSSPQRAVTSDISTLPNNATAVNRLSRAFDAFHSIPALAAHNQSVVAANSKGAAAAAASASSQPTAVSLRESDLFQTDYDGPF